MLEIEAQLAVLKAEIDELGIKLHFAEIERDAALMQLREESERRTWLENRCDKLMSTIAAIGGTDA